MTKKKLHPSVEQFKEFVKKNPKIVQEVRSKNTTWQALYEDWYLLGEDDPKWDAYRAEGQVKNNPEEKKADWMGNIVNSFKKMDPNQMQGYIQNLNQALSAVQGVLSQFQGGNNITPTKNVTKAPSNPFVFKKD